MLSAVNLLRSPLLFLPLVLQSAQEARTSLGRLQAFLRLPERRALTPGPLTDVGVRLQATEFAWEEDAEAAADGVVFGAPEAADAAEGVAPPYLEQQPPAAPEPPELPRASTELSGAAAPAAAEGATASRLGSSPPRSHFRLRVDLTVSRGELVAVVGSVGAGKSTLLGALTGSVAARRGTVHVRGSVAYAAQRPFVLSSSVRDNILFGLPYDEARYHRVLDACALTADLALLPAGDRTQIGERGLSLSGGQVAASEEIHLIATDYH